MWILNSLDVVFLFVRLVEYGCSFVVGRGRFFLLVYGKFVSCFWERVGR